MPDRDDSSNAFVGRALNYKACRDESRRVECLMHCVDSLEITASEHSNSSNLSQSQNWTPIDIGAIDYEFWKERD
jgi:hypothetical protein